MRGSKWLALGLAAVGFLGVPGIAFAASEGVLDPSFNGTGTLTQPIGSSSDRGQDVAVDSQGRVVVVGYALIGGDTDFAIARFRQDGTPDTSFSTDGKTTYDVAGLKNDAANGVAIDSEDRIVVAGYADNGSNIDFALMRFTEAGVADEAFGTNGHTTTPIGGGADSAASVAIDSHGRIVVGGYAHIGSDNDFAVTRYTEGGVLDSDFNSTGKSTFDVAGIKDDEGAGVAVDGADRVLLAGNATVGSSGNFAIARFKSDGNIDTAFGTNGKTLTPVGSGSSYGTSLAIDSQGRPVVGGYATGGPGGDDFAVARYTPGGTLDSSFDGSGKRTYDVSGSTDRAHGVTVDSLDRIILAGSAVNGATYYDPTLVRITPGGGIDSTFGTSGSTRTPFTADIDSYGGVAMSADERIVAAGYATNSTSDFIAGRYIDDTVAPTATITDGPANGATTATGRPQFSFVSSEPKSKFACRFDVGAPEPCSSPYAPPAPLADGSHLFTVTAFDRAGNESAPATSSFSVTGQSIVDATAPSFTSARVTNKVFVVDRSAPAEVAVARKKRPKGTSFNYALSEAGRVVFTVERRSTGRKVRRKCVRQTRKNRRKKACKRYVRQGRFAVNSAAGPNSHKFSGRIGRKSLKPGSYRVRLVATDPSGNASAAKTLSFKIVRR